MKRWIVPWGFSLAVVGLAVCVGLLIYAAGAGWGTTTTITIPTDCVHG